MTASTSDLAGELAVLSGELAGRVRLPGTPDYEIARKPGDPRHHGYQPAAVAYCRSGAEVAAIVGWADRLGLGVTPRSGGHCFAGRSSAGDVVLDVSELNSITVTGRRVEVGSGVRLGDLYPALASRELTLPAGCGPSVGIAGLTLGGGLGLLGRRYGLTCDRLVAAEVVLADGRIISCDADDHDDLFWALRGAGGGHFGIVTHFVFDPIPEPEVTVFRLGWSADDAADVVAAWMAWAPVADDRLTAQLQLFVPADPRQPAVVVLVGTMIADPATTRSVVGDVGTQAGGRATDQTFRALRYGQAKAVLGEDPAESERPLESHHSQLFDQPCSENAVTTLLDHLVQERRPAQTRTLSFLPLGGAYNRVPAAATAFAHRDQRFLVEHISAVPPNTSPAGQVAAADWSVQSRRILAAEASGGVYPNFPDPDLEDWAAAYWGTNHARLQQLKQRFDPNNRFWARQGLHIDQAEESPG